VADPTTLPAELIAELGDNPLIYPEDSNNFKDMIHGIHGGEERSRDFEHVRNRNGGIYYNWSEVVFPQSAGNCLACHIDNDSFTPPLDEDTLLTTNVIPGVMEQTQPAISAARDSVPNDTDIVITPTAAACYAENNLPVMGKDQVRRGREMSWVRMNRYIGFRDDHGEVKTEVAFMPMMCQQCGNAPCESVCPSLATYHNREGLNAMVYNRCVGTRYCSNNCTYKVRRFNWFYPKFEAELAMQLNPEVSVRDAGVMEKCTFCVQRIRAAKDKARDEDRLVADGEVQTACQQVCPAQAISFGNAKDDQSVVAKKSHEVHAYRSLDNHLHTKPGVSYMKKALLGEDKHA